MFLVVVALFTMMVLAALPVGGVLQTSTTTIQSAFAQPVEDIVDADTLTQEITDEVDQEIEQEAEQEAEHEQNQDQSNEQSAEQSNEATVSQDEENNQANVIETGDNTAATIQVGDNDAIGNEVEAESEGGDSGDASANKDSEASSEGGDAGDATAALEQSVSNEDTTIQDSSADGNILSNENEFGDDIALMDQKNTVDQDALNVGIQEQDLTQTIDQIQEAVNTNVDFDVQVGVQQPPPPGTQPPGTQPPGTQPPGTQAPQCPTGGFTFNAATGLCERTITQAATLVCPSGFTPVTGTSQCERAETQPPFCSAGGNFNPATNQCFISGNPVPGAGPFCLTSFAPTFNPVTHQCEGRTTQTGTFECPSGFTLTSTNQCTRTETATPT